MSSGAASSALGGGPEGAPDHSWQVRRAALDDAPAIARAVADLLRELGAKAVPAAEALEDGARTVIEDERLGVLLVAYAGPAELVGVLGASWQTAVRVPGEYGLVQELWVDELWRDQAIGAALLAALVDAADARGTRRLEVGLPGERFARLDATRSFYEGNGFTPIGERMRRLL